MKSIVIASTICTFATLASAGQAATIPFVACTILSEATITPSGSPITLNIPPRIASRLALYVGSLEAVLGPRGWACSGWAAGGGVALYVYPPGSKSDTAPEIEAENVGDGSVEISFGRYFPSIISTEEIQEMASSQSETEEQYLVPKYPTDVLIRLNKTMLEFITPAGHPGIANQDGFLPKSSRYKDYGLISVPIPIANDPAVMFVGVQLPAAMADLRPYILNYSKNCWLKPHGEPFCPADAQFFQQ